MRMVTTDICVIPMRPVLWDDGFERLTETTDALSEPLEHLSSLHSAPTSCLFEKARQYGSCRTQLFKVTLRFGLVSSQPLRTGRDPAGPHGSQGSMRAGGASCVAKGRPKATLVCLETGNKTTSNRVCNSSLLLLTFAW